ncbi:MAG: hypothetical protein KDI82_08995 [Gammaproteobacteria bacterium]|nr:hypothetical protein [Gammaproteobacteria bacterium]
MLAELHGRALRRDALVTLWSRCYDGLLALTPRSVRLKGLLGGFCQCLTEIPTYVDRHTDALLSADFRRLYHDDRCSRAESETGHGAHAGVVRVLDRKVLYGWGRRNGQTVADWESEADGSLSMQLRQLACMVATDGIALPAPDLSVQLGGRLLGSVDRFAERAMSCAETRLYRSLATLTSGYAHEVNDLLKQHGALHCAANDLSHTEVPIPFVTARCGPAGQSTLT